jgi:hypothetical protein
VLAIFADANVAWPASVEQLFNILSVRATSKLILGSSVANEAELAVPTDLRAALRSASPVL